MNAIVSKALVIFIFANYNLRFSVCHGPPNGIKGQSNQLPSQNNVFSSSPSLDSDKLIILPPIAASSKENVKSSGGLYWWQNIDSPFGLPSLCQTPECQQTVSSGLSSKEQKQKESVGCATGNCQQSSQISNTYYTVSSASSNEVLSAKPTNSFNSSASCSENGYSCVLKHLCHNGTVLKDKLHSAAVSGNKYCSPAKESCCKVIDSEAEKKPEPALLAAISQPTAAIGSYYGQQSGSETFHVTPYPGCAAALKCVPETYCTADGVMTNTPVVISKEFLHTKVPLTDCLDGSTGITGKCCRDPLYEDPWPIGTGHGHGQGDHGHSQGVHDHVTGQGHVQGGHGHGYNQQPQYVSTGNINQYASTDTPISPYTLKKPIGNYMAALPLFPSKLFEQAAAGVMPIKSAPNLNIHNEIQPPYELQPSSYGSSNYYPESTNSAPIYVGTESQFVTSERSAFPDRTYLTPHITSSKGGYQAGEKQSTYSVGSVIGNEQTSGVFYQGGQQTNENQAANFQGSALGTEQTSGFSDQGGQQAVENQAANFGGSSFGNSQTSGFSDQGSQQAVENQAVNFGGSDVSAGQTSGLSDQGSQQAVENQAVNFGGSDISAGQTSGLSDQGSQQAVENQAVNFEGSDVNVGQTSGLSDQGSQQAVENQAVNFGGSDVSNGQTFGVLNQGNQVTVEKQSSYSEESASGLGQSSGFSDQENQLSADKQSQQSDVSIGNQEGSNIEGAGPTYDAPTQTPQQFIAPEEENKVTYGDTQSGGVSSNEGLNSLSSQYSGDNSAQTQSSTGQQTVNGQGYSTQQSDDHGQSYPSLQLTSQELERDSGNYQKPGLAYIPPKPVDKTYIPPKTVSVVSSQEEEKLGGFEQSAGISPPALPSPAAPTFPKFITPDRPVNIIPEQPLAIPETPKYDSPEQPAPFIPQQPADESIPEQPVDVPIGISDVPPEQPINQQPEESPSPVLEQKFDNPEQPAQEQQPEIPSPIPEVQNFDSPAQPAPEQPVDIPSSTPEIQSFDAPQQSIDTFSGSQQSVGEEIPSIPAISTSQSESGKQAYSGQDFTAQCGTKVNEDITWHGVVYSTRNKNLLCDAVIISEKAVLTAAHCLDSIDSANAEVKVGSNTYNNQQVIKVSTISRHPSYDAQSFTKDLAVVSLREPIIFGDYAQKICFTSEIRKSYNGDCLVSSSVNNDETLEKIKVQLLPYGDCQTRLKNTYLGKYFILNESFTCASSLTDADLCKVKIGSPIACDRGDGHYELFGVKSWDLGCKEYKKSSIFSNSDLSFIENVLSTPHDSLASTEERFLKEQLKGETLEGVNIQEKPGFGLGYGK